MLSIGDQSEINKFIKAPRVRIRLEKDKLLCVLKDCISFEPDIIKSAPVPRLYFFDDNYLKIHNLQTQKNEVIELPLQELPRGFSYVQAHNTIFLTGGEIQS